MQWNFICMDALGTKKAVSGLYHSTENGPFLNNTGNSTFFSMFFSDKFVGMKWFGTGKESVFFGAASIHAW